MANLTLEDNGFLQKLLSYHGHIAIGCAKWLEYGHVLVVLP